jgi:nitrogen regulatory protein PII
MKEIKAYIKPHKLSKVTLALHKVEGLTGMSVVDVRGFGRGRGKDAPHRIVDDLVDYIPQLYFFY